MERVVGLEPIIHSLEGCCPAIGRYPQNMVDTERIELSITACKAVVIPFNYAPIHLVGLEGVEPTRPKTTVSKTVAAASYATDRLKWCPRLDSNQYAVASS